MSNFSLPLYPLEPQMPDAFSMWKEAYSRPPQSIDHKKVTALSRAFKEDPQNVQDNLDDYQARFAARQLYSSSFKREFPTLSSNLNNAQFISRVRDDMGNLIETEGWWNGVANAYDVARDTVEIGYIGTRAMLDGRDLYPYERRKIERARKLQRAHTESQPGWVAAGAELLGTMQETLMYSLGAAKATAMVSGPLAPFTAPVAGFTAAFASSFNLEAGNLYADLIMDGYTPAEAASIGYQYGAVIAGFESLGMKGAGAGLRGLGRELMKGKSSSIFASKTAGKAFTDIILKDYLVKGVGGEAFTEGIQEILAEHGKLRASELYRPDNLYEPEYWDTFWHTVGHTAKGMIVLGGIPAGTRLAVDTIRSAQSQHDGKKAREAVELRRNSKAPEAQEKVDAEAGETLESTYYVRAQDMMRGIRQAEEAANDTEGSLRELLNSKKKGIVAELEEAEKHDGEVKLSKNEWEKVFAQGLESNFTKVAFRNVAFEEGGFTNAEADAHDQAREKLMEEANEETKKALQDMDTFEEELREVRLEMRQMLKDVVKGTTSEKTLTAAHQATLLVGFIRRNSLLMNIGPREYVEKHLPKIIQQNLDAKAEDRSNVFNALNFEQDADYDFSDEDASKIFGAGAREVKITHRESGGYISLVQRSDGKVSVLSLLVPETSRRQGIGKGLQKRAQEQYPNMGGQVSSKYAAKSAYDLGRRPLGEPDATLEDVYKYIDEKSSVNLVASNNTLERQQSESGNFDQDSDYTFVEGDFRPEVVAWAKEQFGDRVAPNGKPAFQNFVRWFGDSKVVDAEGKPMVVYHGTKDIFTAFKGRRYEDGLMFFSPNSEMAARWPVSREREFGGESHTQSAKDELRAAREKSLEDAAASVGLSVDDFYAARLSEKPMTKEVQQAWDAHEKRDEEIRREQDPDAVDRMTYPVYLSAQKIFDPRTMWKEMLPFLKTMEGMETLTEDTGPDAYYKAGNWVIYENAEVVRELKRRGYDGILLTEYVNGDHETIAVFDSNQIKSTNNEGNFSTDENILESSEGQKKTLGQAVFIDDVIKKILLDPDAKPTTLMHELTHWNLEMMATMGLDIESKIAQEGYEPSRMEAEMLGDIQRLIKWSGYKGTLKEWSAMSVEERRPFHEAVAVSFEIYLVEGKAPNRELRGVFERLLAYIGDTYKALVETFQQDYAREFGERRKALGIDPELPGLNPDVRAIFGRMLSASRDVDSFLDENELKTMMISKEDFVILRGGKNLDEEDRGALEAQWNEYHQEFLDAITKAKAELTIHRINEVKYQQRAYERIGKEIKREIKSATNIIRQQEEEALSLTPVYQYRSWIRTGKYQTEEGERTLPLKDAEGNDIKNPKLDAKEVEAADPQNAEDLKKRKLTKKGGVPLEIVRKAFGFNSVEEMLQALAQSKTLKGEVNSRTDQRVKEELTDLTDPVLMQERMQKAVHNNIRRRMVALELKYLLNNGRASKVETALAKLAAKEIIESTATGNIDISAYSRAAARARKKALKALKDGDMEAAAFAKRQELLNESLVSEGLKAREEVRRLMKHNEKVFKPKSDEALGKAKHDVIVVKALRALLSHFGIGRVEGDAREMLARLVKHDPTFYDQEAEHIRSFLELPIAQPRVGDRRKPVEHLTLKQIRTLRMLSERFMHRSKQNIKSKIEGKKQTVKENQELATRALEDNVSVSSIDPDGRNSIFGRIRDWFSDLIRFEHLFRRADGGKEGGIWTKMFRMVKDSGNAYRAEVRDFTLWFGEKLKALDLKVPGGERSLTLKVLDQEVVIGEGGLNVKSKLIHMAMHFYGNSSNRERLVRGYVGKHEDPEVDAQRMEQAEREIRSFFNQQIQQGLLTKADFDFMQSVFSKLSGSGMLARAQEVMMSHSNYEMDTIKGEEFSIPFPDGTSSTYAGGYIPVRYDRSGAKRGDVDQFEEDMSIDGQSHRMLSILPSFTKERTAPDPDPLDLNLSSIQHHAAEVYRFIHMTEPVTEVYKVINGESVRKAFVQRFGAKAYNNMDGWLRRSAHQKFEKGDNTEVGKMMLALSRNANMAVMFLNIGNSLQNYAGLVIPMRRVGARGVISALISSSFSSAARKEIAAKSKEMAGRLDKQIFDIYATQQKLLTSEDGMWSNVKGWTNRWAYVMQQYTQNHVDVAVWQAAYNQETAKALSEQASTKEAEARAVAYADSVVRGSQMAGEKEDLSHFESGGTALKAMFPFKSWFINWMNNAANQGRLDMSDADQGRMLALAQTYMYLLMLPSLLATAATKVAAGAEWGDDDEDFSDDMFEFWFRSQLDQVTGGLPVISDLKRMIEGNWLDDKHWNNRYPTTPWQRGLEKLVQGSAKGFDFDSTMDLSAQFADLAGLPISRAWNSASMIGDELAGDLRSEGTMDLIRGMATGKRSASQRL